MKKYQQGSSQRDNHLPFSKSSVTLSANKLMIHYPEFMAQRKNPKSLFQEKIFLPINVTLLKKIKNHYQSKNRTNNYQNTRGNFPRKKLSEKIIQLLLDTKG